MTYKRYNWERRIRLLDVITWKLDPHCLLSNSHLDYVELILSHHIFRIFATSKTTADELPPTIPPYESPHGDLARIQERHQLQIFVPWRGSGAQQPTSWRALRFRHNAAAIGIQYAHSLYSNAATMWRRYNNSQLSTFNSQLLSHLLRKRTRLWNRLFLLWFKVLQQWFVHLAQRRPDEWQISVVEPVCLLRG